MVFEDYESRAAMAIFILMETREKLLGIPEAVSLVRRIDWAMELLELSEACKAIQNIMKDVAKEKGSEEVQKCE